MTVDELSNLANSIYSDLDKDMNDLILPLATTAIVAINVAKKSSLSGVGLRTNIFEDKLKAGVMAAGVVQKYMAVIMAAISSVTVILMLNENDRDKYTEELTIDTVKPLIETELKQRLDLISFSGSGTKQLFFNKVKSLGTSTIINIVMGLL